MHKYIGIWLDFQGWVLFVALHMYEAQPQFLYVIFKELIIFSERMRHEIVLK